MERTHVLEVAIFKVKPSHANNMQFLRDALREALKSFEGLIEFLGYNPIDDCTYADIVKWENIEYAKAVANAFERGDARFLPYIEAIQELTFMGHFVPE